MRGTGRTVFTGNRIDEFQVEILGVLDNFGPRNPSSSPASPAAPWNTPASCRA